MDRSKIDGERVIQAREFGRVDDEGRVFVRLPAVDTIQVGVTPVEVEVPKPGEGTSWKFVGQYVTGEIDETMELFVRRFVNQLNKCDMLEERLEMPELNITTTEIDVAIKAFRDFLDAKNAVGDYAQFHTRLERIGKLGDARKEYNKRIKRETIDNTMNGLREITERLEGYLVGNLDEINWKSISPFIDNAVDDWKKIRQSVRLPEKECNELWERFITARKKLSSLRSAYFVNLKSRQSSVQEKKNRVIEEARSMQDIEDFGVGVRVFRRLQKEWTEIGYGLRRIDQLQWKEFSEVKDHFYGRLTEHNKSRDEDNDANISSKRPRREETQWNNDLSHLSNSAFDTLEALKSKFQVNGENTESGS
ncbi:MAG: DUF349 domain-containing protein [Candidatus Ancillula sp.]|jgi:hypothetical protein|nr:DUF349 domain-containing protein [Candidatus Ancillula sp.]